VSGFSWQAHGDTMLLREDEFSWQGAHPHDKRFFLRRSKQSPDHMTDVFLGSIGIPEAASILSQFWEATGGLGSRLVLTAFADDTGNHDLVVAEFDRLTGVVREAIKLSRGTVTNSLLQPYGRKWDAIIELAQPAS
jgi:hypothetical protein